MPEALRSQIQKPTFPALPPHLSPAVGALPVGELLEEIAERYGGGVEHARVLGEITHGFIVGRIKARTLLQELERRFAISEEYARIIAGELYDNVFEPMHERLKTLPHEPPRAEPIPPPRTPLALQPLPRPITPSSQPAPPVPAKPMLRPAPAPPVFVKTSTDKPVTEATADLTLEKILVELPHELRSAVRNVPLRQIIYALGREHRLTIEEIGQLAEGVLEFISGKIRREQLLETLTRLLQGDRTKAASASDELNAKVFGPIREAMQRATAPPPVVSRVEPPPPPKPPTPPMARKPEPLIIYPLPMTGSMKQEAGSMERETPAPKPPTQSVLPAPTPTPPSAPPTGGPPPTLPVYEEARQKVREEFEEFKKAPPKSPPPTAGEPRPPEPHKPDPYREAVE